MKFIKICQKISVRNESMVMKSHNIIQNFINVNYLLGILLGDTKTHQHHDTINLSILIKKKSKLSYEERQ